MKRKSLVCLICICFLVSTGCGSKKVKNESDIALDLLQQELFVEEYAEYTIDTLKIDKRQTNKDDKVDYVYVDVNISQKDEAVTGKLYLKVTYGLYEEGWLIDSCERAEKQGQPSSFFEIHQGNNFDEKEISDVVASYQGMKPTNITLDRYEEKLSENYEVYYVSVKNVHTYVKENLELEVTYYFETDTGKWTEPNIIVTSQEQDWNIDGTWSFLYEDKTANPRFTSKGPNEPVIARQELLGKEYTSILEDVFSVDEVSLEKFVLLGAPGEWHEKIDKGYEILLSDGYTYQDFEYVFYVPNFNFYFVGRDEIFVCCRAECQVDDLNEKLIIELSKVTVY